MFWFGLWSFFLEKLCSISLNSLFCQAWNSTVILWVSAPKYYLDILDRFQNCVCKVVDPSLLIHFNLWLIVVMWLFWVYFTGTDLKNVSLNLLSYFLFFSFIIGLLDRQYDFMVFVPGYYKDSFFHTFRLWSSLLISLFWPTV